MKKYYCYIPCYRPQIIKARSASEAVKQYEENVDDLAGDSDNLNATGEPHEPMEMSREWECTVCGNECRWSYEELAEQGSPVCNGLEGKGCDSEMSLIASE